MVEAALYDKSKYAALTNTLTVGQSVTSPQTPGDADVMTVVIK
jgi:hypothetical protein